MSNIVDFSGITRNDIDPDKVLKGAFGELTTVIIVGRDKNGELYRASSSGDAGNNIILCELFKQDILCDITDG